MSMSASCSVSMAQCRGGPLGGARCSIVVCRWSIQTLDTLCTPDEPQNHSCGGLGRAGLVHNVFKSISVIAYLFTFYTVTEHEKKIIDRVDRYTVIKELIKQFPFQLI